MKVLITGGAGFIGSNLVRTMVSAGHDVTVLDDLSNADRDTVSGLPVRFVEGSVLDTDALDAACEGVGSVVHLAALGSVPRSIADPVATHRANASGTLSVLEAARRAGTRHVVLSSSSSVYGMNPTLPKTEREWVRPLSPYAVSKLAAEQYVLAYQQSFGMTTLAFRFFNVYGPGQRAGHVYAAVVPVFVDALLAGRSLPVNGDGSHSRDFTFVGTVCAVLRDAVERGVSHPEPVNLAFGTSTRLDSLIEVLGDVTGRTPVVDHRPERPGDVRHSQADPTSLRSLFPDVEPVPLRDGLARTVEWFEATR